MKRNLLEYVLAVVTLLCVMLWSASGVALFGRWLEKEPKSVRYTTGDMVFTNTNAPEWVGLESGGSNIITIGFDGKITLPKGMSLDETSKMFWDAVARMAGHRCPGSNEVTWPEVER